MVGKEDIEDLVLRLAPGVEVDGHFKIESTGQQSAAPATLPSVNLIPAVSNIIPKEETSGNGASFVFRNLAPDKYLPQLGPLPSGTYLKSIRLGSQDVTGKRIDLTSGAGGTLEIVLSPHAAVVTGILRNSDGDPLPQIRLTLWAQGFAPKSAVTDASGVFHFTNLPPGEYRVAAWDQPGLPPPAIPEFLSQFENTAATVKLDEDSQQTIEVPVIKPDAIDAAMVNVR